MSDTPRTDAAEMACFVQDVPETFLGFARELERENATLKQRILDDNKTYGFELRDPSGTIWDHAKKLQTENDALRSALDQQANYQRELRPIRSR
jgi:hypothetical protein